MDGSEEAAAILEPYEGKLFATLVELTHRADQPLRAFLHGDFHQGNMLLLRKDGEIVGVKIIDIQVILRADSNLVKLMRQ